MPLRFLPSAVLRGNIEHINTDGRSPKAADEGSLPLCSVGQCYQKRVQFKMETKTGTRAHCHLGNTTFGIILRATPLMKPYLPSGSDSPQLPTESPGVPSLLCPRAGKQQERRVHGVLRQRGGHGHLHVWTHVPVPQLRPAAPKAGTGLLSHLPAAHQGCYQDL